MTWTPEELAAIDAAHEIKIAGRRRDGTLRRPVTIWLVRVGDDLYVRSVNGADAAWYRGTRARRLHPPRPADRLQLAVRHLPAGDPSRHHPRT
jgi:hypothetical protein